MTGFFTMCSGLSFLMLSPIAGMTISRSNSDRLRGTERGFASGCLVRGLNHRCHSAPRSRLITVVFPGFAVPIPKFRSAAFAKKAVHRHASEVLDDRSQCRPRKEGQRTHDQDGADEQHDESHPLAGKLPELTGISFFFPRLPATRDRCSANWVFLNVN